MRNRDGVIIQPAGILLVVAVMLLVVPSGCLSQQPKVIQKVNPVIDYTPLGGFTERSDGVFIVLKGNILDVKGRLNDIVVKKAAQPSTFSVSDDMNLVVFRGVFSTGGYGIDINRVERQGNEFIVYANYTDPGKEMVVTQAFTQPTAIIPVGKLEKGNYKASLKVTKEIEEKEGKKIIETEKELNSLEFKVE
jgi:hypothetical protein